MPIVISCDPPFALGRSTRLLALPRHRCPILPKVACGQVALRLGVPRPG